MRASFHSDFAPGSHATGSGGGKPPREPSGGHNRLPEDEPDIPSSDSEATKAKKEKRREQKVRGQNHKGGQRTGGTLSMTPDAIRQRKKRQQAALEAGQGPTHKAGKRPDGTLSMTPNAIRQRKKYKQKSNSQSESASQSTGSQLAQEFQSIGIDNPRPHMTAMSLPPQSVASSSQQPQPDSANRIGAIYNHFSTYGSLPADARSNEIRGLIATLQASLSNGNPSTKQLENREAALYSLRTALHLRPQTPPPQQSAEQTASMLEDFYRHSEQNNSATAIGGIVQDSTGQPWIKTRQGNRTQPGTYIQFTQNSP